MDRFEIFSTHQASSISWLCKPFGGGVVEWPRSVEVYFDARYVGSILTLMDNFELYEYFQPTKILQRIALETTTDTDLEILQQLKERK